MKEFDREQARITVRLEMRRFRKPVTVIQGVPTTLGDLRTIARRLKHRLATGGTAKSGVIILQGDHRNSVKDELARLRFPTDNIEIH